MQSRVGLLVGLITVALRAGPALAARQVHLVYQRLEDASGCPDEDQVRNAVSARLGYDPFRADASERLSAILRREGRGLRAHIELRDGTGDVSGSRVLTSASNDCSELAAAMALTMSIIIDPLLLGRQPVEQPSPPSPPQSDCPTCPSCPELPRAPPERPQFRSSLGALGAIGAAPNVAFGISASAGLRYRAASVSLEGRSDLPAEASASVPGRVASHLLIALLVPCAHHRAVFVCALGGIGALQGEGRGITAPRRDSTLYAAAGARLGAEWPFYRMLSLRVHGDLLTTLTRTTLQIDGRDAWTTPALSGVFGVGLAAHLP